MFCRFSKLSAEFVIVSSPCTTDFEKAIYLEVIDLQCRHVCHFGSRIVTKISQAWHIKLKQTNVWNSPFNKTTLKIMDTMLCRLAEQLSLERNDNLAAIHAGPHYN